MSDKVENYIDREKTLLELEYEFIKQLRNVRKENHLTQQKIAEKSHVIRETVARIENLMTSPQISTVIKILEPIGYTIKIVPISESEEKK